MMQSQADLFAADNAKSNLLSEADRRSIRQRLETALAKLEAARTYPWSDPLDAVHEENSFERGADMLGEEGAALWARFDHEMERLHAMQS